MSGRIQVLVCSALLVTACGGGEPEDTAQVDSAASSARQADMPEDVRLALTVARAIDATPSKADSILSANGLTVERLDSLMYVIAADSAKTAAYEGARH